MKIVGALPDTFSIPASDLLLLFHPPLALQGSVTNYGYQSRLGHTHIKF